MDKIFCVQSVTVTVTWCRPTSVPADWRPWPVRPDRLWPSQYPGRRWRSRRFCDLCRLSADHQSVRNKRNDTKRRQSRNSTTIKTSHQALVDIWPSLYHTFILHNFELLCHLREHCECELPCHLTHWKSGLSPPEKKKEHFWCVFCLSVNDCCWKFQKL